MSTEGSDNDNGETNPARQLRIEALKIHKDLLDRFSLDEVKEIIRNLTAIEAVLSREEDDTNLREVDEP
jgi:hypothetical protein